MCKIIIIIQAQKDKYCLISFNVESKKTGHTETSMTVVRF